MRAILLMLTAHFLMFTATAQKIFIQGNAGYVAAINHNSYNDGKLRGGFTGGVLAGIGFKRFETGISLTAQKVTERFPFMVTNQQGVSAPATFNIHYGNPLFTAEVFANIKHKLGPVGLYGGILAGIAAPWGGMDKSYTLPEDLYNDNISGGIGIILGGQIGGSFALNKHWAVLAGAAYKYIRLKPEGYNFDNGFYTFSMIPVTAGIRYTF